VTPESLARTIDHALLQPTLSEREFEVGCDVALRYSVAALCVKSADVQRAEKRLRGSPVAVCAVVGFPHGNAPVKVTAYESTVAMEEGATEIDAVINVSRVLAQDFEFVTEQIATLNATVTDRGGLLKVIFETGLIGDPLLKVRLCEICKTVKVAFVKTSTGFATEKLADGTLRPLGATEQDVRLLVEHAAPICQVKASGGIRTREAVERFLALGATRIGTASTADILASNQSSETGR
jgi:deoxyribose-phosphate aldolase